MNDPFPYPVAPRPTPERCAELLLAVARKMGGTIEMTAGELGLVPTGPLRLEAFDLGVASAVYWRPETLTSDHPFVIRAIPVEVPPNIRALFRRS